MPKTEGNLEQAIEKLMTDIYESLIPESADRQIFVQTLELISRGCPVNPDEIAIRLQTTPESVNFTVRRFGTEFDNEGNILGLGLKLVPTPHSYEANDRRLHTWCAVDALAFPVILGENATIESHDPVTREKVSLRVTPDAVENLEPKRDCSVTCEEY